MKTVKIENKIYIEMGALGTKLLKGIAPKSSAPVDTLINRIVKVLDKHGLKREISGVCWSDKTEKDYTKRLKSWVKKAKGYSDRLADRAIAMESLNSFPLAVKGLDYNKLYFCLNSGSDNTIILKGKVT